MLIATLMAAVIGCDGKRADSGVSLGDTSSSVDSDEAPGGGGAGDSGTDSGDPSAAIGVLRLGPPAPSVGIYGIAADAERDLIYVSNLHVPFITVADRSGAWVDALDLRPFGIDDPHFPRLYTVDGVLWGTHLSTGTLFRFDLETREALSPVSLPDLAGATAASEEGVWVALTDRRVVRYAGEPPAIVEELPIDVLPNALDVQGDEVAVLAGPQGTVSLYSRSLGAVWTAPIAGYRQPEAVAVIDGRVFVADRETGEVIAFEGGVELGRVATGSDTFSLTRDGDRLLVVNRQGAALPDSGSYEGAPGRITALSRDLEVIWTSDQDKTSHFLAWDGQWWWTANEDSLNLSAVDPADGAVVVRGPELGLTVDHIAEYGGRYFFGSHLTDALWRADFSGEAAAASVCGWPFFAVFDGDIAWVPCQETGDVAAVDPETMAVLSTDSWAETFHADCGEDGLCTGHARLMGASLDGDRLAIGVPHTRSVQWAGGAELPLGAPEEQAGVRHMGLRGVDGALLAYDYGDRALRRISGGAVADTLTIEEEPWSFPLIGDGDWTWVGRRALAADLSEQQLLPEGYVAAAAGGGWLVAVQGLDIVVLDRERAEERARLSMAELRVPPYVLDPEAPGPLRLYVDSAGPGGGPELIVANLFRGTLERRAMPGLEALGDELVAVGPWAELEGLR